MKSRGLWLVAGALIAALPARAADPPPVSPAPLAVPAAASTGPVWAVRLPAQEKPDFRGQPSFDSAGGGTAAMMYPAPSAIGMLAAVLTHAAIVNATRSSEKSKLQLEADKVLLPYQESLATLDVRTLFQRALDKGAAARSGVLVDATAAPPADGWLIESAPVFLMTPDQRAIVLENTVAVFGPRAGAAAAPAPAYQNVVRVVSLVEPGEDPVARWNADQGRRLKDISAELLARSFEISLQSLSSPAGAASAPQRTFRFPEGGRERMERAQLVSSTCERVLVRNLRGWLMSIPLRPEDAGPDCATATATATGAASAAASSADATPGR